MITFHSFGPTTGPQEKRELLWEWLENGNHSRIYRFGEMEAGGGFIIGGLKPSQAIQLVEFHNCAIVKAAEG